MNNVVAKGCGGLGSSTLRGISHGAARGCLGCLFPCLAIIAAIVAIIIIVF